MSALLSALDSPAPIVLAPTGMVPTKAMTPHVPITPAEIARDVAAAAAIGITSVHLHARDEDGAPTWDRATYERIVGAVRDSTPESSSTSAPAAAPAQLEKRADCLGPRWRPQARPGLADLVVVELPHRPLGQPARRDRGTGDDHAGPRDHS